MKAKTSTSKIRTIIAHEYLTKVKTKGFIIATILGPVLLLAVIFIPILVTMLGADSTERKIAIVDYTEKLGRQIEAQDTSKYFVSYQSEEALRKEVLKSKLDGYLLIPKDFLKRGVADVYTMGGGGIGFLNKIETNVREVARKERLREAGVDLSVIRLVEEGVQINTQKITKEGTEKDYAEAYAVVGYVFGFIIYTLMLLYGSFVSRGVIEEKANRIIEVIASSARPFEIMMGKVIGIGFVGLTQTLFWVILSGILLYLVAPLLGGVAGNAHMMQTQMLNQNPNSMMPSSFEIPSISPWIFIAFIFYFLSGYFLYATLFAAVGSAVDQESDAQQLQLPIMVPIIIPILLVGYVISNPESTVSVIFSLIPLFTPILMMVRVAATPVPLWQIIASIILMVGSFYGCVWLASRIYRVGILMYGKKPNLKDLFKWVKQSG